MDTIIGVLNFCMLFGTRINVYLSIRPKKSDRENIILHKEKEHF